MATARSTVNGMHVEMTFGEGQDPTKIIIEAEEGLQNQHLRAVAWGEVIADLRRQARRDAVDADLQRAVEPLIKSFQDQSATRKRAIVSGLYVLAVQAGSGHPLIDVSERLGVSIDSVKTYIRDARKRGYLTRTPPGVIGGEITREAVALLVAG
ncbi:hypothetical protein OG417_20580 [Actinoallomurus sp. NBC_01490]|uniref:hypothetical protein n=1 Tax=Actinoallomurus sp. NBC_01490 TaxID=2903557 RepID=UPI002E36F110|nr:hypothetical protein [Actinoallomurus sp. NBC_01490]